MPTTTKEKDTVTKPGLYTEDTYSIMLPLEKDKQADVTVGVNGVLYKIKRGEQVEVPAAVYEVLMNMQRMDNLAIQRMQKVQNNSK